MKFAAGAALALALVACSDPKPGDAKAEAGEAYVPAGRLEEVSFDHTLGDASAPVQIVVYASLQCTHCRDFEVGGEQFPAVFPQLKEKYIDTGKVRWVYRDYPLDAFATAATMAANCIAGTTGNDAPTADQNERYFAAVKLIFERLDYWYLTAGSGDVAMQRLPEVLRAAGMSQSAFDACLKNEPLLARIRGVHDEGTTKFVIEATPTFFINGEKHSGALDFAKLEAILAKQLPSEPSPPAPQ